MLIMIRFQARFILFIFNVKIKGLWEIKESFQNSEKIYLSFIDNLNVVQLEV